MWWASYEDRVRRVCEILAVLEVSRLGQCPRHPEWIYGLAPLASPELGDIQKRRWMEQVSAGPGTPGRAVEPPSMSLGPFVRVSILMGEQESKPLRVSWASMVDKPHITLM